MSNFKLFLRLNHNINKILINYFFILSFLCIYKCILNLIYLCIYVVFLLKVNENRLDSFFIGKQEFKKLITLQSTV